MTDQPGASDDALTDPEALRAVLAEALDVPAQSLRDDDNLIALGLDSIVMMGLAARWQRAGASVSFGALAAEPTPAAWRALLSDAARADADRGSGAEGPPTAAPAPGPGSASEEDGAFPLALMQHAYWAGRTPGQRLGGVAAHFYHEFDGAEVDPERLETALRALFARHPMLRTRILDDGTQRILDTSPWPGLRVHDLRGADARETREELERIRAGLSHRRLDIEAGEVFDVRLSLLAHRRTRLHLNLDMVAADALSLRVLLADLAALYETDGREPSRPLGYDYRRYLADRAAHREGPGAAGVAADRAWWRDRLAELPGPPALPAAPDSGTATTVVRRHRVLDPNQWHLWDKRARAQGLTPAMALTAVFAEVLTAWSDVPEFLLNLPLFDREQLHPEVDGLVGDFTSSVLPAWDGARPGSFAERARRLQERFHADVAHARYSGVEVLRDLTRLTGRQTLAPVVHTSALGLGPLFADAVRRCFGDPVWLISQGPQVWLDAQITELDDGLLVNWDAREAAFAPGVLDAMFAAYGDLIDRLLEDDAAWTSPAPDLLPAAQRAVRRRMNDTGKAPGAGARLHEAFFARAAECPQAPALLWGADETGGELSYGALAERALAVAGDLRARGVRPGDLVGVQLPQGPDQIVAVLGVLAAGAAYLPLAADQPASRIRRILETAGVRLVLDDLAAAPSGEPLPAPVGGDPDDLAYVLFTSGSTGEPKGVEVTHAAAMGTVADLTDRFGLGPDDRTLALSALAFDLTVFDVFAALTTGGAVVRVAEAERRDAAAWVRLLHRHRATVLNCAPALLDMLLTAAGTPGGHGPLPAGELPLRAVLVGGDRVTADLPARLAALAPRCRFAGLGGTTETAIHSTVQEVSGPVPEAWSLVPYGTPLRGVACRVVDALGRDRPDHVPGELWIGGAGVARGYRNDPERTAERFLTDGDGLRWYRTGDRARYLPDGTLEFLGRTDHQVKVRGHRIELGEIEAALRAHPAVSHAVALPDGDRGLAAAVTPAGVRSRAGAENGDRDGAGDTTPTPTPDATPDADASLGPDPAALREFLAARLPAVMVPDVLAVLPALPLTPNGKTDREALRTVLDAQAARGGTPSAPRTPPRGAAEKLVAAAWRDVLDLPEPGPGREDDFFALGGDSLLATRLLSRLRADGAAGAALGALFAHPDLAGFARTLRLEEPPAALPAPTADPEHRHDPFPPTDVQRAYWLGRSEEFTLGGVGCHYYREYDVTGLDPARLEEAVNELVRRHEMLRAVVDERGDVRILPEVPRFTIPVADGGADPEAARAALRAEWSHHVFDPARWPLFSLAAVRDGDRFRLAVGIDNLVLDALSILTFFHELSALYAGCDVPPPPELSFRDHVLGAAPAPGEREAAERYWDERLESLPPAPRLPLAADPAELGRPRFTRRTATLDPAAWSALTARARAHGVTPSAVLLTAYADVLSRWSAEPELTVNLTLFDRGHAHPDIGRVMGDFTSLVLVGHHPAAGEAWLERTRRIQQELWEALDRRAVSAVEVLRRLARRTGEAGVSMPVVFTSALGLAAGGTGAGDAVGDDPAGILTDQVWGITQTPQVWLDHQAVERRGPDGPCVDLHWDAVDGLFPDGLLDAAFDAYVRLLREVADGDWARPAPVRLPPDQRETRRRVNATEAAPREPLLHAPFFRRAAETPQATAVLSETGGGRHATLTYGELADRARRVAALLTARGVAPGEPVAVSLPKGPDQIAAVLGVLAAGAAYVPIGVDQPARRRDGILAAAGVRFALAEDTVAAGQGFRAQRLTLSEALECPPADTLAEPHPDGLAYVIFTSGSTGEPKGVETTHRAAANTVEDVNDRFRVGADDRVLAVSALDFDLSVYDVFGLLGAGGAVVTVAEHERRDAHRWAELARRHRVTVWNTVPALLDMLLIVAESTPEAAPDGLRLALLSGDWIGQDLAERLSAALPGCALVALGGATEASIWSNAYEVRSGRPDPGWRSVPYGYPLRNQRYRVVDADGADCPDWVPGELWIGGTGLARGYRGAPELTAARFVERDGRRWYRTGDLGRYRPDGRLEFLGRADDQVKVRGHRIELGEIEAALTAHPGVARAAAAVTGRGGARALGAAVTLAGADAEEGEQETATGGTAPPGEAELRTWLAGRLPEYMVPERVAVAPRLPMTANGKVDRAAVAALASRPDDGPPASGEPPRGPLEETLARLWSKMLETPVTSRDANFFALGGDSVTALRFVERATAELGRPVPLAGFFAHPTLSGLADHLACGRREAEGSGEAEPSEEGRI